MWQRDKLCTVTAVSEERVPVRRWEVLWRRGRTGVCWERERPASIQVVSMGLMGRRPWRKDEKDTSHYPGA